MGKKWTKQQREHFAARIAARRNGAPVVAERVLEPRFPGDSAWREIAMAQMQIINRLLNLLEKAVDV